MSESEFDSALTYTSYLAIDDLLSLQKPLSDGPEHDEMLFIIIHQSYELWFKQLIHEFNAAAKSLESGDTHKSLALLGRIRTILKVCVTQVDILETMTPLQFNAFRGYLSSSSGFQSALLRKVEALLGRRDNKMAGHLPPDIQKDIAYISVSDRVLGLFLEQCKIKNLEPGVDVGFLSYNETPMKEFIYKGISVVSTDFKALGTKAAEFIMNDQGIQEYIETKLIVRESL